MSKQSYSQQKKVIPLQEENMGRVFFYESLMALDASSVDINLNNKFVGKFLPHGVSFVDVTPGEYKITAEKIEPVSFSMTAGEIKYFRIHPRSGFYTTSKIIIRMDRKEAEDQMDWDRYNPW